MDWMQLVVAIISIGGIFLWSRSEARSDMRHMDSKIDNLISAIQQETKDFHGRMCALEEKKIRDK